MKIVGKIHCSDLQIPPKKDSTNIRSRVIQCFIHFGWSCYRISYYSQPQQRQTYNSGCIVIYNKPKPFTYSG